MISEEDTRLNTIVLCTESGFLQAMFGARFVYLGEIGFFVGFAARPAKMSHPANWFLLRFPFADGRLPSGFEAGPFT